MKVTPSSKVVGDMALFMNSNNLTVEDVMKRGVNLSFPDTVKALFRGDFGQPEGGWPVEIQKIVLKDEKPYTNKPNEHLEPIDFAKELPTFIAEFKDDKLTEEDLLSYKLYPKVYKDFHTFVQEYGNTGILPTSGFFYPMQPNEEILVELEPGKNLLVRYMYKTEANDEGSRDVFFKINGMTRSVSVHDRQVAVTKVKNRKVKSDKDIGVPLQGRLIKVLVKEGDSVKKNQALFMIEAMKMESTISAPADGVVSDVYLDEGVMVEQDDCVLTMG